MSVEPSCYLEMLGTDPVVHQAVGMMSAQMHACLEDAALRLRAESDATERSMEMIAADVVARRLRFS